MDNVQPTPTPDHPAKSWWSRLKGSAHVESYLLMLLVTLGFFILLGLMCFHEVPDGNRALLNVLLGALGAGWTTGVGYFWGSSLSSRNKDATISSLLQK